MNEQKSADLSTTSATPANQQQSGYLLCLLSFIGLNINGWFTPEYLAEIFKHPQLNKLKNEPEVINQYLEKLSRHGFFESKESIIPSGGRKIEYKAYFFFKTEDMLQVSNAVFATDPPPQK